MYEQEVKLTAPGRAVLGEVLRSDVVRRLDTGLGGQDGTRYLGIYYDTEARQLEAAGCSLRARLEGRRWRAALKYRGTIDNGLSRRRELEADIGGWLDCAGQLPDGALKDSVLGIIPARAPLLEYLRIDMRRSIRNLAFDGTGIELCADHATIAASSRRAVLYEIELELKHGDIGKVVELGGMLMRRFPLTPSTLTKRRIGLNLA